MLVKSLCFLLLHLFENMSIWYAGKNSTGKTKYVTTQTYCQKSFSILYPRSASQLTADLRQFAKQETLQHAVVPAHLDKVDKHTLMHPNVHPHTCTLIHTSTHALKFMSFSKMSQQDIRAPEDDFWYLTWMADYPVRAQCCICVHQTWAVDGSNAINDAAVFPWKNN